MRRILLVSGLAFYALGCGDPCEEAGVICTRLGTGLAGLAEDGACALEAPTYLVLDSRAGPDGLIYLLDWNNHRIARIEPGEGRGCDTLRVVSGNALLGDGPEGPASSASWNHPTDIDFDAGGGLVFAAWHNSRIVRIDQEADLARFVAGTGARNYGGDGGPAAEAILDLPVGVRVAPDGSIYLADQANQRVRVIDPEGVIHSVVGTGEYGYNGDGIPAAEAELFNELSQAASPAGKIDLQGGKMYIADTGNHRIRVVDMETWTIDTFAGNGVPGASGDGGPAGEAQINGPRDVAVGPDGSVYIADTGNDCVRVVKPDGIIDTAVGMCGSPGFAGDQGPAADALVYHPYGVEVDPDGDLWVADTFNHRLRRVVTP